MSDKYTKHIHDLTYFYIKKKYKKYCKKKQIKFIKKDDINVTIKDIFIKDKEKYRMYILDTLREDFKEIDETEINQIITDMIEDADFICKRLSDIIDEYQIKQGFY